MKWRLNEGQRILVYGDINKLERMMDSHFLDQLRAIGDDITQTPKTIDQLNEYIRRGEHTHLLIPDENFHVLEGSLNGCSIPVIELLLDHWVPWVVNKKRKYIDENGIEHVIVFTGRFLQPYEGVAKFYPVLCGFDAQTFTDRKEERNIDILIHGSLGEDTSRNVYPVRNFLAKILPWIGEKEGLKVVRLKHPGYFPEGKTTTSFKDEYSSMLNRAKIAIGGSSRWGLSLKKFYEVPASGAILLTDLPVDDQDFFKGRVIEVNPRRIRSPNYRDELRREIMNTLENYDASKERLQPFRTRKDRTSRSYEGRALEIKAALATI